jgi:outer membrane protein OmpA-like peptidoglycan-associated protein
MFKDYYAGRDYYLTFFEIITQNYKTLIYIGCICGSLLLNYQTISAQENPNRKPRILTHPADLRVEKIDILNTPYREVNLNITPDGKYLFFMSTRGGQPWNIEPRILFGRLQYDGDIYYSKRVSGKWQAPVCVPEPVNTENGEDEPNISPDGQTVYYQSWRSNWQETEGPYYQSTLNGTRWGKLTGMGGGIGEFFRERFAERNQFATDGATIGTNGDVFIVACGFNYDRAMDIYMSRKNTAGQWDTMKKLAISTNKDDRSVFLAADGKTLYFASKGYGGMGGLDIFKTVIDSNGQPGEIINIGPPFNTPKDDYGLVITASGEEAFFVREGDIYTVDLRRAHPEIRPQPILLINGILRDSNNLVTEGYIRLLNSKSLQLLGQAKSDSQTGEYAITTPQLGLNYLLEITYKNGVQFNKTLTIPKDSLFRQIEVNLSFEKNKLKPLTDTLLVYFGSTLDTGDIENINNIHRFARQYQANSISFEIIGHTDSEGGADYNRQLGQRRAEWVSLQLTNKGIDRTKIKQIYSWGAKKPVATNSTDTGKQQNRRVEIIVQYQP